MGTHAILFDQMVLPALQGKEFHRPQGQLLFLEPGSPLAKSNPAGVHSGTPNFKEMSAAAALAFDVRHRVSSADSLARVLELKTLQKNAGLWFNEELAPEPHTLYHLAARLLETVVALEMGAAGSALLATLVAEWRSWCGVMSMVAAPDGEVFSPCARFWNLRHGPTPHFDSAQGPRQGPGLQVATAALRCLLGKPQLGPARTEPWWHNPTGGAGIEKLRSLVAPGQPLHALRPIDGNQTRLAKRLTVHRWQGGHIAALDRPLTGDEPWCDWIEVRYGDHGHHQVTGYGVDGQTPVPPAPAGAMVARSL